MSHVDGAVAVVKRSFEGTASPLLDCLNINSLSIVRKMVQAGKLFKADAARQTRKNIPSPPDHV